MKHANVIGRKVAYLRNQLRLSQDALVARLQVMGCDISRDVLANIETLRSPATDKHIEFFAQAFGISEQALFPDKRHFDGKVVGVNSEGFSRRGTSLEPVHK
jgi:transcriptional regulator with XRE-family HTH domain